MKRPTQPTPVGLVATPSTTRRVRRASRSDLGAPPQKATNQAGDWLSWIEEGKIGSSVRGVVHEH